MAMVSSCRNDSSSRSTANVPNSLKYISIGDLIHTFNFIKKCENTYTASEKLTLSTPWAPRRCRPPRRSSWPRSPWIGKAYRPLVPLPCSPPHAARRRATFSASSSAQPTPAAHWKGRGTAVSLGRQCPRSLLCFSFCSARWQTQARSRGKEQTLISHITVAPQMQRQIFTRRGMDHVGCSRLKEALFLWLNHRSLP